MHTGRTTLRCFSRGEVGWPSWALEVFWLGMLCAMEALMRTCLVWGEAVFIHRAAADTDQACWTGANFMCGWQRSVSSYLGGSHTWCRGHTKVLSRLSVALNADESSDALHGALPHGQHMSKEAPPRHTPHPTSCARDAWPAVRDPFRTAPLQHSPQPSDAGSPGQTRVLLLPRAVADPSLSDAVMTDVRLAQGPLAGRVRGYT